MQGDVTDACAQVEFLAIRHANEPLWSNRYRRQHRVGSLRRMRSVLALAFVVGSFGIVRVHASSSGPPAGFTGAPVGAGHDAESTCAQCHNTYPLDPDDNGKVELLGVPERYVAGQRYRLTFRVSHAEATRWGFQLTAIVKSTNTGAGDFAPKAGDTSTQCVAAGERTYIEHGPAGRGATGIGHLKSYEWEFDWIAPPAEAGEVVFYGLGNAANGDGSEAGDRIYGPAGKALA